MCRDSIDKNRKKIQEKLADHLAGPFKEVLPRSWIEQILTELEYHFRESVFSPLIVLWTFVGQVLDPDQSCNQALARIQAHRVQAGLQPISTDTGAYCKARIRLPELFFKKLFMRTGQALSQKSNRGISVAWAPGQGCRWL